MELKLNERLLRMSGKMVMPKELQLGQDYRLSIDLNIIQEDKRDNQDGSYDLIYVAKPIAGQVIK